MPGELRALIRRAGRVDRTRMQVGPSAVRAVVVAGCLVAGIAAGRTDVGLTAAFGALMTAVQDQGPTYPQRVRGVALGLGVNTGMAFVATLVSGQAAVLVATAALVALMGGLSPLWGPVTGRAGSTSVKTFAIMAAFSLPPSGALLTAGAYALGGLVQLAVLLVVWAVRGGADVRPLLSHAWRDLGHAVATAPGPLGWGALRLSVGGAVTAAEAIPAASRYAQLQLRVADGARAVEMSVRRTSERDADRRSGLPAAYRADVAAACLALSRAITRRSEVRRAYASVQAVAGADALDPGSRIDGNRIRRALIDTESAVRELHQTGSSERHRAAPVLPPLLPGTRTWSWSSPIVSEAIRLAIMFALAELLAKASGLPHSYWIAMTVAVVTVPGYAASLSRLSSRLAGTVAAVVVFEVAFALLPRPSQGVLVLLFGLAAFVYFLAFFGNYAIATFGITSYVLLVIEIQGTATPESAGLRLLATLVGGVIVIVGSTIHARRSSPRLAHKLADYADAVADYWATLVPPTDTRRTEAAARRCRRLHTDADLLLDETFAEPWRHGLEPAVGAQVLHCLGETALAGTDVVDRVAPLRAERVEDTREALHVLARLLRSDGHVTAADEAVLDADPAARQALQVLRSAEAA